MRMLAETIFFTVLVLFLLRTYKNVPALRNRVGLRVQPYSKAETLLEFLGVHFLCRDQRAPTMRVLEIVGLGN